MDKQILIFVIIQMANVMISTWKSVITVNGSPLTAAIINAVSYSFAACVTKLLTVQSFEVVIIVTMITNITGVYVAKWMMERTKTEKLWTITATLRPDTKDSVENMLQKRGVQYTLMPAFNDRFLINIYSYSRGESSIIKEILDGTDIRFCITETKKDF